MVGLYFSCNFDVVWEAAGAAVVIKGCFIISQSFILHLNFKR